MAIACTSSAWAAPDVSATGAAKAPPGGAAAATSARPTPSDCDHTAIAWPSAVTAIRGERAKPPGADRRAVGPKASAPGAWLAA